jgi:CMP-N-acetylneuraminic acid synthetase
MSQRVAVIPARGNSKGIKRKNLHRVAGRPLLGYTVDAALASGVFEDVIVSSECDEVLAYACSLGATPRRRPARLSEDDVHSVEVVLDVVRAFALDSDAIVSMLLPTSPLRGAELIREAVDAFEASDADSLVSVFRDTKHLFQLRRIDADGALEPLFEGNPNVQRQDVDELYVVNGSIYLSTADSLNARGSFHLGRVIPFVMDRRLSVDINTPEDIAEAEARLAPSPLRMAVV